VKSGAIPTTPLTGKEHIERILLTRLRFIGDVVLTTPLLRALREEFPRAHIAYLAEREAASLLRENPYLNEILAFDFDHPLREQFRLLREVRKRRFDLVIDLYGNPRSAQLCYFSGAPVRVGGDFRGRGSLYTIRVRDDGVPKSAIAFHYQYLRAAGIDRPLYRTQIFLTGEERREAEVFLADHGADRTGRIIALHAGATWPAKHWGIGSFAELAKEIRKKLNAAVVLTCGPGDRETVEEVARAAEDSAIILPVLPIRKLAAVLSACDVLVSNDCGPMHIGVAVGTPTIGIFGPGEENIWFPYDEREGHRALRKDVPCHPCHLDVCNRTGDGYMECMKLLGVGEVLDSVAACLKRSPD
jgi:lipopolysaccharide heptosyltransferase II